MERKIEFKVEKETLSGSLFIPEGEGPFPSVIFFHGSGGKGEKYYEFGKKFAEKGILAFAFNFAGCGESSGNYLEQTHEDAFRDAKGALDFLLSQKEVSLNRIGLAGGSFGGFIAAMVLPEINIKSLVLLSPSAHDGPSSIKIDMGTLEKEVEYFADKKNWENAQSFRNVANYKGPLLVIKSENDQNVPSQVVDKYYNIASNVSKKEMKTLKGADHRLSTPEMRNEVFNLISEWFLETL